MTIKRKKSKVKQCGIKQKILRDKVRIKNAVDG